MAWITVDQKLIGGKLRDFAKRSGISQNEAIGILIRLWLWGIDNAEESGRIVAAEHEDIEEAIRPGFLEIDRSTISNIVDNLIECGWIDQEDSSLYLHDWMDWRSYYTSYEQKKAKHAERMRDYRAGKKKSQDPEPEKKPEGSGKTKRNEYEAVQRVDKAIADKILEAEGTIQDTVDKFVETVSQEKIANIMIPIKTGSWSSNVKYIPLSEYVGERFEAFSTEKRYDKRGNTSTYSSDRVYDARHQFRITDSRTAELTKYMENSFLATKVSFCQQFYFIASEMDVDYEELRELFVLDPRVNPSHTFVDRLHPYWSSHCLDKDVPAIADTYEASLLQEVIKFNENTKKCLGIIRRAEIPEGIKNDMLMYQAGVRRKEILKDRETP